jgi:hypothetical protein
MKIMQTILYGFFDYHKRKNVDRQSEFDNLCGTSVLHSSDYLTELHKAANGDKAKEDIILDHMNKHAAYEVESYKLLESKIINKRWRS